MLAAEFKKQNVFLSVYVCELFNVPGKYRDAGLLSQETESRLDPLTTLLASTRFSLLAFFCFV